MSLNLVPRLKQASNVFKKNGTSALAISMFSFLLVRTFDFIDRRPSHSRKLWLGLGLFFLKSLDIIKSFFLVFCFYFRFFWGKRLVTFLGESHTRTSSRNLNEASFLPVATSKADPIKAIAFYLPQFHPIPQNDDWWGRGFTEWTNVVRGRPQFVGHYQPKLPLELGFYDLRVPEVISRQIELATEFGVYGFCFYFYWFNGQRLLEQPLELFQKVSQDFPFCVCWANENWTRTWDGKDKEILLKQEYLDGFEGAFFQELKPIITRKNYIKVNGKPLIIVYRPASIPDVALFSERLRAEAKKEGVGELFLACTHSFEQVDPRSIGFDCAIEFAPNKMTLKSAAPRQIYLNPQFQGTIYDYNSAIDLANRFNKPAYLKFRGACPGWDNEARRPGKGTVLVNSSPESFKRWLSIIIDYTRKELPPEQQYIFINSWNEWAEGAHLEPDSKNGYDNLIALRESLFTQGGSQLAVARDGSS